MKSTCKNSGTSEGKKVTRKRHLAIRPSCTKPFNCSSSLILAPYSQQETAQLPPLEDFVHRITSHFVEITTYTKADGKLSANIGEVPPLIPPGQRANKVLNTEASKNSVYLTKKEKLNDVEGNNLFSCMHYFPPMRLYIRLYQSKLYLGSMAHF